MGLHSRTLFQQRVSIECPDLFKLIPAKVWKQKWVVHCQPAGAADHALRYLSQYIFKTATANRTVYLLPSGQVRRPCRDTLALSVLNRCQPEAQAELRPIERVRQTLAKLNEPAPLRLLRKLCGIRTAVVSCALNKLSARGEVTRHASGYQLKRLPVSLPIDPQGNGNGKH